MKVKFKSIEFTGSWEGKLSSGEFYELCLRLPNQFHGQILLQSDLSLTNKYLTSLLTFQGF